MIINAGNGYADPYALTSGESVPTRLNPFPSQAQTLAAMRFTTMVAAKTENTGQVRVLSGSTASATLDLARIGLYRLSADLSTWSLVAATVSDTSLLGAINTTYTRSWAVPYAKVAGQRYGIGILQTAGAGTAGALLGMSLGAASEMAIAPRLAGQLTGQTDLPASFLESALATSSQMIYTALLP